MLASVAGDFAVYDNAALTSLSVPVLATVGGYFWVHSNTALTSLSVPVLATVGVNFTVQDNTMLPSCQAQAIVDQLTSYSGLTTITGNDDAGTCP